MFFFFFNGAKQFASPTQSSLPHSFYSFVTDQYWRVFTERIQKLPDWNSKNWKESGHMKLFLNKGTKMWQAPALLLSFTQSVFSNRFLIYGVTFWWASAIYSSYGWPCVLCQHHLDCNHGMCVWLCVCVCLLLCGNANMTLAMTSPGMSLSGCALHPTLLRRQTRLISVDRPREHRTAAFYCCHSHATPFPSPLQSSSQFPNLWFIVMQSSLKRERELRKLWSCVVFVLWTECNADDV